MSNYPDFERCWEFGPHGYGHNGIGGTMAYVEISPSDPAFYMHHSYIDRVYRVWQNADPARRTSISGLIADGSPLTMDTRKFPIPAPYSSFLLFRRPRLHLFLARMLTKSQSAISLGGIKPDVRVRDVIDTLDGAMCYRYSY